MSFNPKAVFLLGPVNDEDYVYLYLNTNKHYLCSPGTENDINTYSSAYADCSGGEEWPAGYLGNRPGLGRLYATPSSLDAEHIPLLTEQKVVAVNETTLDVWAMDGDIPAGCDPAISRPFVPAYATMWGAYPTACGKETDDYVFVRDDFYPAPTHKSYIDFYRVHDGVESARVTAVRSSTFSSITVPPYRTTFGSQKGYYTFTVRSMHVLSLSETAYFVWQYSKDVAFAGGTGWFTIYEVTGSATLVQHLVEEPPPSHYVYDYHMGGINLSLDDYDAIWYVRVKRVDKIGDVVQGDSGWSGAWTVTPTSRSDMLMKDDPPAYIPYWLYRDYDVSLSSQTWTVSVYGTQGGADQEPDLARVQLAVDEEFGLILEDVAVPLTYGVDGWGNHPAGTLFTLQHGIVYYARCRYETTDGLTLGAWSNVFQLDGDNAVNRSNYYSWSGYTLVKETHWLGEKTVYAIASESLYKDGHTYVLLCKQRGVYETDIVTSDHDYGSLWLADYNGSSVVLTQIEAEVEDWTPDGWPVHYDIVEFNDKLYAGWCDPADDATNLYDWCEITGGVVGTIHHVAIPAEATDGAMWATMGVIHGDLRVIASLGEAPVEEM